MAAMPYVNGAMLSQYAGQMVNIIGKVTNVSPSGNEMQVTMADGKSVKVALKEQPSEMLNGYIQMIANVGNDFSLTAENIISFGQKEIDLSIYNEAVKVAARHPDLFGL